MQNIECLFCKGVGSIPGVPNAFDENPPRTVCKACNGRGTLSVRLFQAAVQHATHDDPAFPCKGGGPENCPICRMRAYEFIIHPEYHPELLDLWEQDEDVFHQEYQPVFRPGKE